MEREPLFLGTCSRFSPGAGCADKAHGQKDQLEVIFDVIGTPNKEYINRLGCVDAQNYLKEFDSRKGEGLADKFSYVDKQILELLSEMLRFDVEARIDVRCALEHEAMAGAFSESTTNAEPSKIDLYFDRESGLDERKLRKYYGEEIDRFHAARGAATDAERALEA